MTTTTAAPELMSDLARAATDGLTELLPGGRVAAQFLKAGDIIERKGVLCNVLQTFRREGCVLVWLVSELDPNEPFEATITNGVMVELYDPATAREVAAYLGEDEGETVDVEAATPLHHYTHVRVRVVTTELGERVTRVGAFSALWHAPELCLQGAIGSLDEEYPASGRTSVYLGYGDAMVTVLGG